MLPGKKLLHASIKRLQDEEFLDFLVNEKRILHFLGPVRDITTNWILELLFNTCLCSSITKLLS